MPSINRDRNTTIGISSSNLHSAIPHLYDRVNDSYGPGVYVAWVLVAYGVFAQRFAPLEGKRYWNLDKDLAVTILYPTAAAFDLVRHMYHYPGPKNQMWREAEEDVENGPYAAEIWASSMVCLSGVGMNILFMAVLHRSRRRTWILAIVTTWLLLALGFAGLRGVG